MNHKITIPLWLPLVFLVPNLFSEVKPTSPRLAEPLSAVELVTNTSLIPANEEAAAQFDETFSKPIQINDGRKRSYVLAVDELYQPTSDGVGQIIPIKESSKPSTLASVATILAKEKNQETRLILYPVGAPHNDQTRRILSSDVVVKTDNREAAIQAATEAGLRLKSEPAYAQGFLVFTSDTSVQTIEATQKLQQAGFRETTPLLTLNVRGQFLPNDPLFKDQWHIRGRGQNGAKKASDAKINSVWEQRDSSGNLIRGKGVVIGVVDSGVQWDHPDLENNYIASLSYDFASGDSDPYPGGSTSTDAHGTEVAGVSAAVGFNGIGVSGVAPEAQIAGIRIGLGGLSNVSVPFTDEIEASALQFGGTSVRISNNSWGVGGTILAPNGPLTEQALSNSAQAGKIFIFSAGNGLEDGHNTNYEGTKNSIFTLPVAALNDQAIQTNYSSPGSSVVISAPSGRETDLNSASRRPQGTTTTDLTGVAGSNTGVPESSLITPIPNYNDLDYTNIFNGTSSAAPVVSGVTALVLQANSSLNWRDVKEIYIRSATKNDSGDSDWARNGAGFWFNHKYGAGLINASDAVRLAKNWSNLGTMTSSLSLYLLFLPPFAITTPLDW